MKKMTIWKEMLLVLCVSYTVISLCDTIFNLLKGNENLSAVNAINQLLFSAIAILILYSHNLFKKLSPLSVIVIQYIVAILIVFLIVYIQGLKTELHIHAYRDVFRSFTLFYVIGAVIHYIYVFADAKQQNKILQELREKKKNKEKR